MESVNILKVDKDCHVDKHWISDFIRLAVTVCQWHRLRVLSIMMSRSRRKGLHFYIHVAPPVDADLANRLQWILGDDCQRVDCNRARIESGLKEWNKLFEEVGRLLMRIYDGRTYKTKPESES